MLFGDWSFAPAADKAIAAVRDPSNFHWSILTLFAIVLTTYCNEIKRKNFKAVACAAMLYSIHWLYEIANAVICHFTGYALWTVSPESTSFILLIGVSAELSLSAGSFVCNNIFYTLLRHTQGTKTIAGFIHLPLCPAQAETKSPPPPSMEIEEMARALEIQSHIAHQPC